MSSAFEGLPKTPNLKLNKPGYDNVADIEALNENADILDAEIQGIKNTFVKSVNGINAGDGGNVDLGIIPIAKGGTGQTTAADAIKALFGSSAIGSAGQPVYYDGSTLKAGGYTFRLSHNTSDTWIPVFSSGNIDYVLKDEIANTWTGGGIVAASLATNGYVKFANGLILQWGAWSGNFTSTSTVTFPITFSKCYIVVLTGLYNSSGSSYNDGDAHVMTITTSKFTAKADQNAYRWIAIGE